MPAAAVCRSTARRLSGGSDGIQFRTSELAALPDEGDEGSVFPSRFPIWGGLPTSVQQARPATPKQKRPRIHPTDWPEIAQRARHESLRDLAAAYGVSHETIRAITGRVAAAQRLGAPAAD
jgi:hypothetical protein